MRTNSHPTPCEAPILVLAAHGKTGRRVADRLEALGHPVRRGSRRGSPAFDWQKPSGWPAALAGTKAAYVVYTPDLAVPGAPEAITRLTQLAIQQGLERIVLLSGRGEVEAQACERIVLDAPIASTIVRAAWFAQNFSEGEFLDLVNAGTVSLPAADFREPFVDVDDIADVAVAALTEAGHDGEVYELTGPRLLSFQEAVTAIAEATGLPVKYQAISRDEFASALRAQATPEDFILLLDYLFALLAKGHNATLSDGVQRALGRPPRDFRDYVKQAAANGVWQHSDPACMAESSSPSPTS